MGQRGRRERARGEGHDEVVRLDPALSNDAVGDDAAERRADQCRRPRADRQESEPQRVVRRLGEVDAEGHGLHPRARRRDERRREGEGETSVTKRRERRRSHR